MYSINVISDFFLSGQEIIYFNKQINKEDFIYFKLTENELTSFIVINRLILYDNVYTYKDYNIKSMPYVNWICNDLDKFYVKNKYSGDIFKNIGKHIQIEKKAKQ
jgi:hypothetical protein